ncbi:hypothetical protein [Persicirhabdus sediminis]|uniref:Uncharacterized protein n=1 Tax=Persicirhabdus sediminis TaxID=454144 RepID=A0A8J7SHP6_9BACT|nr:hypothetical protein [Persicirhabdus sediminis]MBK1789989.1 hypothetical protein [Persicirhabdus sediminis]
MNTRFWKLSELPLASDRLIDMAHGTLEIPYRMPFVMCCNGWGVGKTVRHELGAMGQAELMKGIDKMVPVELFMSLRKRLLSVEAPHLQEEHVMPGVSFLPFHYQVPYDKSDFSVGYEDYIIVSDRVVELFDSFCAQDISAYPLSSGYKLLFTNRFTPLPDELKPEHKEVCKRCGNPDKGRRRRYSVWNRLYKKSLISEDFHFFSVEEACHIFYVSNELKVLIENSSFTNISFEAVEELSVNGIEYLKI